MARELLVLWQSFYDSVAGTAMKFKKLFAAIAVGFGLITSAHAGLVGVKTIEVTNAIGTWLQVAEVVALDMGAT